MVEPIERVLSVLNHKEPPDRIPIDFGSPINGIHHIALRRLLSFIGAENYPVIIFDKMQGLAEVPEFLLRHFGVDFRHVRINPPLVSEVRYISQDSFVDEFGITFERRGYYFEMVEDKKPLYNAKTLQDVEKYIPPKAHEGRVRGLRKIAKHYNEDGYAVAMNWFTGGLWELTQWLHGISNSLRDIVLNPELMNAILDKVLEIHMNFIEIILNEVGDYIHIMRYGDDYGTQLGPQMSPKAWEYFIYPRLKKFVSYIKNNAKVKVLLHSCGGIRPLIPKFIDAGIDILNPLQPRAKGMDRKELKKEFGGKLIFHGGLDEQYVLPRGTIEEIETEVKDVIQTFSPGGEYIFSPAHNIQPDVPPQNILTAYTAALRYGTYTK
ncbi:MAG: uroporphyrinogen decarboxylase family protein [Nitrososphaerota archaeon]